MLLYHSMTAASIRFFFWQRVANNSGNSRAKKEKGSREIDKNDSNANLEEEESESKQIAQPKNTQSMAEACLRISNCQAGVPHLPSLAECLLGYLFTLRAWQGWS